MSWKKVKISEVYEGLYDGPHATPPDSDEGAVFLGISNISKNGHLDLSNIKYINEKDLPKWTKRVTPKAGDIVFSYEATLNLYAIIPEGFWGCLGRRMALIRPDEAKAHGKFLFYYFFSEEWRATVSENTITGATVDRIPIAKFPEFVISLPPLEIQHKIADTLSAYDALIENNQKQIKLLEEAAQRLYKEWFVDLHFPGYENTPVVDGVPEGWNRKTIAECLSFHGNGGWGKEEPFGKNVHPGRVIRGTDIEDIKSGHFQNVPMRYHTAIDVERRTLKSGDIVFELSNGNINNIGRCLQIDDLILNNCGRNVICASFCKLLRPIDKFRAIILYCEIQDMQASGRMLPLKKHGANGINNFDFEGFLNHVVLIPDNGEIISTFDTFLSQISTLRGQLSLLYEARDRLLPKLMSGEIEL